MVAEETFLKAHGKWLDTNYYRTPDRTPPNAVVADLGLRERADSLLYL